MKEIKIIIKGSDLKPSYGHQGHTTGSGIHKDKRKKRNRTRGAQKRKSVGEWQWAYHKSSLNNPVLGAWQSSNFTCPLFIATLSASILFTKVPSSSIKPWVPPIGVGNRISVANTLMISWCLAGLGNVWTSLPILIAACLTINHLKYEVWRMLRRKINQQLCNHR